MNIVGHVRPALTILAVVISDCRSSGGKQEGCYCGGYDLTPHFLLLVGSITTTRQQLAG